MTTPPASPLIPSEAHIDELGELIAGLPGMLGFVPDHSLVLSTFTRQSGPFLGPTIRVDLPDDNDDRRELVDQLGNVMARNDVVSATIVVVCGGNADPPDLPHSELIDMVTEKFAHLDVRLTHAAWVPSIELGGIWWCYQCDDCAGRIHDPGTSTIAAVHAVEGMVTFASRDEMRDVLAPDDEDRVAHRAQLLATYAEGMDEDASSLRAEVTATVEFAASHPALPELDDEQIARLSIALSNQQVRDHCLTLCVTGNSSGAERLWTVLTRTVPTPERAVPATLLGLCAYLRGSAVLASMALEIALDSEPDLRLALLLRTCIDRGTPPDEVLGMVETSAGMASNDSREEV